MWYVWEETGVREGSGCIGLFVGAAIVGGVLGRIRDRLINDFWGFGWRGRREERLKGELYRVLGTDYGWSG